jgi:hypothetical protein
MAVPNYHCECLILSMFTVPISQTDHRSAGFLMVKPVHPSSSPRLGTSIRIFVDLFYDLMALYFAFSDRRRPRRQQDAYDDFVNLVMCWLNPSEVLTGLEFTYLCS